MKRQVEVKAEGKRRYVLDRSFNLNLNLNLLRIMPRPDSSGSSVTPADVLLPSF